MSTIKDVAVKAGVSFTTVSHVLNETRPVNQDTRARVLAAVQELGYSPSAVARSLKTRATMILGALVPNVVNPYFAELTRGMEDHCRAQGYSLFLCNCDDEQERQTRYLQTLMERRVDGLLLASSSDHDAFPQGWSQFGMPMVVVDRQISELSADWVGVDHEEGARLAVAHLINLGHRSIACIAGPVHLEVSQARIKGWRAALAQAGLSADAQALQVGDFSVQSGYQAASDILQRVQPSAVFASNDMMAIGVLRAARERGLAVPEQLSVVGFDGIEASLYTTPALSTVGYPIRKLGEQAAAMLIARIQQPHVAPQELVLTPQLVARESSALCTLRAS